MEELKCVYCEKIFSNKSNLKNHQLKTKYCLNKREEENIDFQCKFCKKTLSSKFRLENHYETCKQKFMSEFKQKYKQQENTLTKYEQKIENYEKRIEEYKGEIQYLKDEHRKEVKDLREEIKELQNQLKDLTEKAIQKAIDKPTYDQRTTTNTNNKTIDNRTLNMVPMNLTQESIMKALEEKFTENHLMQGQKGLADFFVENVLISSDGKYLMKCTDPSRKTFVFIDNEGRMQKDVNADRFTKMINGPVKKVSKRIYDDIYDRYTNNYNPEEEDEETNEKETDEDKISYATDRLVEITSLKNDNSEFVRRLVPPLSN